MMSNINPVTFEVLKHRLWAITEEGAATLRNVSGSPTVSQSNDCNVAILNAAGEGVIIGATLPTHALSCIHTAKYVLREFKENPGIGRDDMFLSNDPYISTPHQTCVVMVAPIYSDDQELIAWAGAGIHVADVGGPVPGQVAVGAQSIYQEATPMPPVKMVEHGSIRKDIEQDYLIRSRTRGQNALDMRAKIAANNTIKRRVLEMAQRYGKVTVTGVMDRIINLAEARLRGVLRELPDGNWSHTSYLDYNDRGKTTFYTCHLTLTKKGENLIFNFDGSSPQAPAVINCTYVALESSLMVVMLALFGYAIPLCPEAVLRVIETKAETGTVVNCSWPAGASKGTTSMSQTIRHAATICLSKMFAASDEHHHRLLAVCQGQMAAAELGGRDQRGEPFGGVFIDTALAGGYGARSFKDGIDTGGMIGGAEVSIPNVETNEFRYPILYLLRRQQIDSGGPGQFRGGAGLSIMVTPHDVERIPDLALHSHGLEVPTAFGLYGGYPGCTNQSVIKRDTKIEELFKAGAIPQELNQLEGKIEITPGVVSSYLNRGDIYYCLGCGGGGYGDPLERDPELVLKDIQNGTVSGEWARRTYGVVVIEQNVAVNINATGVRRRTIFRERQKSATLPIPFHQPVTARPAGKRINSWLQIVHSLKDDFIQCRCGHILCRISEDYRDHTAVTIRPWHKASPYVIKPGWHSSFQLREFYCPGCYTLLDVDVKPG